MKSGHVGGWPGHPQTDYWAAYSPILKVVSYHPAHLNPKLDVNSKPRAHWYKSEQMCKFWYILIAEVSRDEHILPTAVLLWVQGRNDGESDKRLFIAQLIEK